MNEPAAGTVALVRRDRLVVVACVAALTIAAWAYLAHLGRQMAATMAEHQAMADMGMPMTSPWTLVDAGFAFVMWAVMMAGMMTPSATPVLLVVARSRGPASGVQGARAAALFAMGYLLVWTGFSGLAAIAQWGLHDAALLSPMMTLSTRLGGAVLVGVGLYQLTPVKGACLTHCRNPVDFLMSHWRGGAFGAVRMGAHHGLYCLGCCWALMAVLFAVGVMQLVWVAALAVFVLLEKAGPAAALVSRTAGAALVVFGLWTMLAG